MRVLHGWRTGGEDKSCALDVKAHAVAMPMPRSS